MQGMATPELPYSAPHHPAVCRAIPNRQLPTPCRTRIQGGLVLNYSVAITGPQAGPIVWLDTAGMAVLAPAGPPQAAAPTAPASATNSANGTGGAPLLLLARLWLLGLSRQLLAASPAGLGALSHRQGDPGWGEAGGGWPAGAAEWADRCWAGGRQQAAAAAGDTAAAPAAAAAETVPQPPVALFDSVVLLSEGENVTGGRCAHRVRCNGLAGIGLDLSSRWRFV